MKLHVFNYETKVGMLVGTEQEGITFTYDEAYLLEKSSKPLSYSLPLKKDHFTSKECLPFFTGLLPDGELKRQISRYLHVSEFSSLKLLEALGGECAGTVSLFSEEELKNLDFRASNHLSSQYKKVEPIELSKMIVDMEKLPLLIAGGELRLSLAGAQQKLALARFDDSWFFPLLGSPSTHILKPSRIAFSDLAVNEAACMYLARNCGLPVPDTELLFLDDVSVFVIARYDRFLKDVNSKLVVRTHQEDTCQALGIMPDKKYEMDGGPSFSNVINLINKMSSAPIIDIRNLLNLAIFNFLIGNCDAHGKNISFLCPNDEGAKLAPFYDLVSTCAYEQFSTKMSMKIGGEYKIEKITRVHFFKLGEIAGVGKSYMDKLIDQMLLSVANAYKNPLFINKFNMNTDLISRICSEIQKRSEQLANSKVTDF